VLSIGIFLYKKMRERKKSKKIFWKTVNTLKKLLNTRKTRKYCGGVKKGGNYKEKITAVAKRRQL